MPGVSSGFEDTVEIEFTLDETTPSGTDLYMVTWKDDCVEPPDIGDKEFTKYFTVNDTEDCTWWVSVNTELIGVPDYPDSTVSVLSIMLHHPPSPLSQPLMSSSTLSLRFHNPSRQPCY